MTRYVADLHVHSRFSRACSPQLNIPNLSKWARIKGIDLLGTGDFLHPSWFAELKKELKEDDSGFLYQKGDSITKFVLSVEIATIYTHNGQGRRVHSIVVLPSFAAVAKLQKALTNRKFNLSYDGRPMIGLSTKDLLALCLEASEKALFIPAHAWTPWFGVFGSKSGYDCLQDCFEDLTKYVYAVETGMSSDPAMNWRIKELDNKSIVSFSDAHSLPNLGREVTILEGEFSYEGLWRAITQPSRHAELVSASQKGILNQVQDDGVVSTIEFFPEEGKYHYTGHRLCNVKYSPEETRQKGVICPVCRKGLTVGVMERVEEIATWDKNEKFPNRPGYTMLVPLLQIISESLKSGVSSKKVITEYERLTNSLGSEINILVKVDLDSIAKISNSRIAEGVGKMRNRDLNIDPGYDGVYGKVHIW